MLNHQGNRMYPCRVCRESRYEYTKSQRRLSTTEKNLLNEMIVHRQNMSSCNRSQTLPRRRSLSLKTVLYRNPGHVFNVCIIALLVFFFVPSCHAGQSGYPPTFNAAFNKDVTVSPVDGSCGDSPSPTQYCRSFSTPSSVTSCWESECFLECPYEDKLPISIMTFNHVQSGLGDCVMRNDTVMAPGSNGVGNTVYFAGSGTDPCYLTLVQEWLIPIALHPTWDITLTVWVKPQISGRPSTLLSMGEDIMRFFIDDQSRIAVHTGSEVITHDNWNIPLDTWTFVAIQVQASSVTVFLHGIQASETIYDVTFSRPIAANQFRVGRSFLDGDPFVGFMQDLEVYTDVLTNREILEVYSGVLPGTRIQTACRCPPSHPLLKTGAETYCVTNQGQGRPDTEMYRLRREAHPLEFINDAHGDTQWISNVGSQGNMIEIALDNVLQVQSIQFQFYSPLPGSMIIERRPSSGGEWEVWQYYSHDCQTDFHLPQDGALADTSDTNCLSLIVNGAAIPYTGGIVTFDPLLGRPGQTDGMVGAQLKAFTHAHAVRISLSGHPYTTDPKHAYHGISEVAVYARCDCNGHSTSCDVSVEPYVCTCSPESYSQGRTCDTCVQGAFVDTTLDVHSPDRCGSCDCDTSGTINGDITCADTGGQCNCKPHVTGRRCDVCEERYFNLQVSNDNGCEPCTCNDAGTSGDAGLCDGVTGQCACKSHVTGRSCDQCEEGFYGLEAGNQAGCTDCQCHTDGTVDGAMACDQTTGQCQCKARVTGRFCDQCMDGTYGMDVSIAEGCTPCGCDPEGAHNSSCDAVSGHCYCKPQVVGITCDQCEAGYYALDADDFMQNGCHYECDCDPDGTVGGGTSVCEPLGGQCQCKAYVQGRGCDTCTPNAYGFNSSESNGCRVCDCDAAGTVSLSAAVCDLITGQCYCKVMVEGRTCDQCVSNTYGLSADNRDGCQPCDCYAWGTIPGSSCDIVTGHCQCLPGAGEASQTNYTCTPYILSIEPAYGPESGGTLITVHGGYLGGAAELGNITIDNFPCDVDQEQSTEQELVCVTRAASQSVLNTGLQVHFFLPDDVAMDSPDVYMYKEDPVITDVYPLSTIQSGGIVMTVIGQHFDSVKHCVLDIYLVYDGNAQVFSSECDTISAEELNCPTPAISLPEERRRRDITEDVKPLTRTLSRVRREDNEVEGSSEEMDVLLMESGGDMFFYFGFHLDGVEEYLNMTGVLPNVGPIVVYRNPEFEMFPGEDHLEFWRPYWPFNENQLIIKGERLDLAAGMTDYSVTVGVGSCKLLDLYTNQLLCTPPGTQPDPDDSGTFKNAPTVTVHVGNLHNVLGYLKYEMTFWDTPAFRWGIIGGVAGLLCAILLLVLLCCCCCRASEEKKKKKPHPYLEMETNKHTNPYLAYATDSIAESNATYMNPESDLLLLLPEDLRDKLKDCLIEPKRMNIGKSIGQGHYGRVYLGNLYDERITTKMTVAIKTLREFHVTPRDVSSFLEEATMMKDFKHVHVLYLMGVVIDDLNRCYVLLPYMENGDMKAFISNEGNMLTVGELINFGLQVADGMVYLSHHKFVHRDLAARNCMVDKNLVIKIADFGLSRDLYERDYYRTGDDARPLPVKWMSLESLEHGIYTTKSDVWSYGVLLWELMTRGCTPYPDVDPFDIKTYIMCGNRMDKPDFAPTTIYQIMLECWDERPDNRPTFSDLIQRMSKFLESSTLMRPNCNKYVRPRSFQQMDLPVDLLP